MTVTMIHIFAMISTFWKFSEVLHSKKIYVNQILFMSEWTVQNPCKNYFLQHSRNNYVFQRQFIDVHLYKRWVFTSAKRSIMNILMRKSKPNNQKSTSHCMAEKDPTELDTKLEKKSYLSSSALIWKASSSQSNNLCVNSLTSCCWKIWSD